MHVDDALRKAERLEEADDYLSKLGEHATVHGWRVGGGWLCAVVVEREHASGSSPRAELTEALVDAVDALWKQRAGAGERRA